MRKTATGIPSLCLIFAVLCMTILALMSLSSARREEKMALEALEQTRGYYDACSRSEQILSELSQYLSAADEAGYKTSLKALEDLSFPGDPAADSMAFAAEVALVSENGLLTFRIPFSDTQQLYCSVSLSDLSKPDEPRIRLTDRSCETIGTWNPDLHQKVYMPNGSVTSYS